MKECQLGWVLHVQVGMVLGCVELDQRSLEVRAHLRHDLFAPVECFRVEHAPPTFGDEYRVDVEVVDEASAAAGCLVWLPARCRRPTSRCVP